MQNLYVYGLQLKLKFYYLFKAIDPKGIVLYKDEAPVNNLL